MLRFSRVFFVVAGLLFLAGGAGGRAFRKGEKYAIEGDWDRAVIMYRQALQEDPENVSFKTRLIKAQDAAATQHFERASMYLKEKNADAVIFEAQQAIALSPGS